MNEIKDIEAIFESANQAYSSFGDDLEDVLENAISLHRQVLDGLVSGHSGRYLVLENLGTLYIMQSTRGRLGGQDDIDYAMESFSEGIGLLPNGDDRQPQAFLNLARAHHAHFLLEKRRTSIDRAIAWYREVLKLGLDLETHTKVTCRLLLALALVQKHESASCLQSLIEAVAILRGLLSIPSVHIISLQRLADVLASHYKQLGGVCALAESETLSRKALSLCSPDDVSRGPLFASLGRSLLARIQHSGEERVNDLDEAIAFLNNAVQSRSSRVLSNVSLDLALLCARRYGLNHNSDDLDKAAELFERIIDDPTARPVDRISAASHWIMLSTTYDLQEMKTLAYTSTYHLIKRLYFFSPHLNIFLQGMRRDGITDLACDAAAYALQEEGPARALEILEYARGLMWGYGSRVGSPFEGLPMSQRSTRLIKTADLISGANVGAQLDQVFPLSEMQLRAAASRCRRLHAQFEEDLVQVCNEVPGFRHIFLQTSASELMHVAERGPVVVLLASRIGCSAIVIKAPSSSPMHVLLPRVSIGGLRTLIGLFTRFRGRGSESHDFTEDTEFEDTDRHIQFSSRKVTYDDLLARLWKDIISPVVTALGSQKATGYERPRLWWCATGLFGFLPIHAAGFHSQDEFLSQYFVSSYTPTLTALLNARKTLNPRLKKRELRVLLVAQPNVPGYVTLPHALRELEIAERLIPPSILLHIVRHGNRSVEQRGLTPIAAANVNVTVIQVLQNIVDASVVHFACHGKQHPENPLSSAFVCSDGELTVASMLGMRVSKGFLAILSACESAMGDKNLPDQEIHLAATMLYVGFRSVVGTLWSMNDKDGPEITKTIYETLFTGRDGLDQAVNEDDIPYALDKAVNELRIRGVPSSRWATYIHTGV